MIILQNLFQEEKINQSIVQDYLFEIDKLLKKAN